MGFGPATLLRSLCIQRTVGESLGECLQHPHDLPRDPFQFLLDLVQIARRLEDVKMPDERNLVTHLRLRFVDPGVWEMWLYLALEVGMDVLFERHVLVVA